MQISSVLCHACWNERAQCAKGMTILCASVRNAISCKYSATCLSNNCSCQPSYTAKGLLKVIFNFPVFHAAFKLMNGNEEANCVFLQGIKCCTKPACSGVNHSCAKPLSAPVRPGPAMYGCGKTSHMLLHVCEHSIQTAFLNLAMKKPIVSS